MCPSPLNCNFLVATFFFYSYSLLKSTTRSNNCSVFIIVRYFSHPRQIWAWWWNWKNFNPQKISGKYRIVDISFYIVFYVDIFLQNNCICQYFMNICILKKLTPFWLFFVPSFLPIRWVIHICILQIKVLYFFKKEDGICSSRDYMKKP